MKLGDSAPLRFLVRLLIVWAAGWTLGAFVGVIVYAIVGVFSGGDLLPLVLRGCREIGFYFSIWSFGAGLVFSVHKLVLERRS